MKSLMKKCSTSPFSWILIPAVAVLIFSVTGHSSRGHRAYLLNSSQGVLFSDNGGSSWKTVNKGLPAGTVPLRLHTAGGHRYLVTMGQGIFHRKGDRGDWQSRNSPDFKKRSQFFNNPGYRKISAFAVDPTDANKLALATKHTLYRSGNGGETWQRVVTPGLHSRNYITSLALRNNRIYIGTSFNGYYRWYRGRFRRLNRGLPQEPYSGSLHFTEEMTVLSHDSQGALYAGFRFGGQLRRLNPGARRWQTIISPPGGSSFETVHQITWHRETLYLSRGSSVYLKGSKGSPWQKLSLTSFLTSFDNKKSNLSLTLISDDNSLPELFYHLGRYQRRDLRVSGKGRHSIYASVPAVRKKLGRLIKTIKSGGMNAIVIDMKDDFGRLYYPTSIKTAQEIRSARRPAPVRRILQRLKKNNIYTIARIVIFKDEKLFKAYRGKYAIKDRRSGKPWRGSPHEYWVDPHSKFVQDYNINIARELEFLGFDEIQFDYIRFPSDGPTWRCSFSFKKDKKMYKSEILEDFLTRARNALSVPISTDIYGFNSWYSFGNAIGQDMEAFSRIVDVISPMVYPSHFGNRFYMKGKREKRPFRIVYDGGMRAVRIADPAVTMRPYIQAFRMMSPTWGPGYIINQVEGAKQSGCSGFTFWNARGDYKMVRRALQRPHVKK